MAIPDTVRLPLAWIEVSERARPSTPTQAPGLIVGQSLSDTGTVRRVTSVQQARSLYGAGSQIVEMVVAALAAADGRGGWYAVGVADPGGGSKAAWTLTVTASASHGAGTIGVHVGQRTVSVPVGTDETASTIADRIASYFASTAAYPVTGTAGGAVATLTYRHAGTVGNHYRIGLDLAQAPVGVSVAVAQSVQGAGAVDWDPAEDLPTHHYSRIVCGWPEVLEDLGEEMSDRWTYSRSLWGLGYVGVRGEADALIAAAQAALRQHRFLVAVAVEPTCRAAPWEAAAAVAGLMAREAASVQTLGRSPSGMPLGLRGSTDPEWVAEDLNGLLLYGITPTHTVGSALALTRAVTTRWGDAHGNRDERSYQAPQMDVLAYLLADLRGYCAAYLSQARVGDDGPFVAPNVITPTIARQVLRSWVERHWQTGLLSQDRALASQIAVARSEDDPTRLDAYLPAELISGLEVVGIQVAY